MSFNSVVFVFFYAIVLGLYRVSSHKIQNRLLLVASYFFYGCWDWRFLGLIVWSTTVDYFVGQKLDQTDDQRLRFSLLMTSLISNLALLAVFKYFNFFVETAAEGLAVIGFDVASPTLNIILPVGISFYTFQTMSYTIDIYRREMKPTSGFFEFALFVSYFPQLVAGPVERAKVLCPQFSKPRVVSRSQIDDAIWLILSGYFFKCVLADNVAVYSKPIFESPQNARGMEILVGIYAAAFQIYGDFAGYSRIARGISKLFGIELAQNFDRPYLATCPSDFWRRWHITLSTWLRDYLYIPLGGSRGSKFATGLNLMITMLLGGLWHGASWNFVAWGGFHGTLLLLWRFFDLERKEYSRGQWLVRVLIFFQLTCLGWMMFFVQDLSDILILFQNLLSFTFNGKLGLLTLVLFAFPVLLFELWGDALKTNSLVSRFTPRIRLASYFVVATCIGMFGQADTTEFIYFQF